MKNKTINILIYILLAAGLLILNYPGISTLYNRLHEAKVVSSQEAAISNMSDEELEQARQAARAYNDRLKQQGGVALTDAFAEEEQELDQEYLNLLNLNNDGAIGYIEIPTIHVYMVIYHGTAASTLERGAGHLEGTSLPVGGNGTHAVLTGHRGLPSAELFTDLDALREGDEFHLYVAGETLAYRIDQVKTVLPQEVEDLAIDADQDYVTLITCTPYGINSHRLLIRGTRVPYIEETKDQALQVLQSVWQWLLAQKILLLSTILVVVFAAVKIVQTIRRGRKNKGTKTEN